MGKSLERVKKALAALGMEDSLIETGPATTAQMAADTLGCAVNQIAKSIIFKTKTEDKLVLFITAGGQRIDMDTARTLIGDEIVKADAAEIRAITGFAIGGVSPVGHLTPIATFFDSALLEYPVIYAAAGTPFHVFKADPKQLQQALSVAASAFSR